MENKIGRIISVNKTNWNLIYNNEIYVGIINNSYQSETYPVVGDYVVIDIDDYLNCIIKSIYERKNYISKLSVDKFIPLITFSYPFFACSNLSI